MLNIRKIINLLNTDEAQGHYQKKEVVIVK